MQFVEDATETPHVDGLVVRHPQQNFGRAVEAALDAAGITSNGNDRIRVNGEPADFETTLTNGDVLTVAGKITGAR